jgi:hypothetical protein
VTSQFDVGHSVAPEKIRVDGRWPARPVAQEPTYVLIPWRVVSIRGAVRLVGYNRTNGEGPMTAPTGPAQVGFGPPPGT